MTTALRTLSQHQGSLEGQRVLVRLDLDVPLADGAIADDHRIRAALPTLRRLREQGARVLCAAHCGQPQGRREPALSLERVGQRLAELLDDELLFADDCVGDGVKRLVAQLRPGQVLLLENLRFHPGEERNDPGFARQLVAQADAYVDDAPVLASSAQASTVAAPGLLTPALAGLAFEREVQALSRLGAAPARPFVVVLGADRLADRAALISRLIDRADRLLLAGGLARTVLAARGVDVGPTDEPDHLATARTLLEGAQRKHVEILLPQDHLLGDLGGSTAQSPALETSASAAVPAGKRALDIGPRTREVFARAVQGAGTVFWYGLLGDPGLPRERSSAVALVDAVEAVTRDGAFSVAVDAALLQVLEPGAERRTLSHASPCGDLASAWLLGKPLPGLQALGDEAGMAGADAGSAARPRTR